ncbi:MAG TPA: ATP-binding protein, partial [Longimicrobiaceae bacterium]|nr:ATP-binding protein [Longimicrobiaceae bacterium]
MTRPADLSELGLASAALMHDLQGLVGALREQAALVVDELETGQVPLASARSVLARCDEIQGLVRDVVAEAAGSAPSASFDPVTAVHREIDRVTQSSPALRISCRASLPGGLWVEGSRTLLERSLGNLLRNATRHARERVEVAIAAEELSAPWLRISVEDDGAGVSDEVRARLFTPGARGPGGGSGVGLASAAWAVGRLGGTVRLAEPGAL